MTQFQRMQRFQTLGILKYNGRSSCCTHWHNLLDDWEGFYRTL